MIDLKDVVKVYPTGITALDGTNLHIDDGEFVFLVGSSGSGKSTIIKLLTAELRATEGSVIVNDFDLTKIKKSAIPYMRRTIGVVFQDFRLIPNMTVYENVAFAMRVIGAREREIRERVPYVLELVGLENKSRRHPNELSGGEQQRVNIARGFIVDYPILLLDEPTNGLDIPSKLEFLKMVARTMDDKRTIIISTHQVKDVENLLDHIMILDKRAVLLDKSVADIQSEYLFQTSATVPSDALFVEAGLGGCNSIRRNVNGEESRINIELLFNYINSKK